MTAGGPGVMGRCIWKIMEDIPKFLTSVILSLVGPLIVLHEYE